MSNQALQKQEKSNGDILRSRLQGEHFKTAVQQVLPKHLTPERFVRVALMAMTRTPKLAECEPASLIQCLLTLSQLGLEPDSRRAHLIPFGKQVQLIIDYKGYVELIYNTGLVSTIHADVVCANDEFEWDRGEVKRHSYGWVNRGEVVGVYAIIKFKDGTESADRMSREDVEAIRKRSRAGTSGPWVTDWNEMAKKTVFRRLVKKVKLSPEQRDAIEADDDQFDHSRIKTAQGSFGAAAGVGLFTAAEQKAIEAETVKEPEDDVPYDEPAPEPQPAQQRPARATSQSPAPAPAAPKGELANDKTRLAAWLEERGFTWEQIKPIVANDIGSWANNVSEFEQLTLANAKAIYAAKGAIEATLTGAPA